MDDLASKLLIGVITGAVSAWIAVRLALRRFREEKWWERKADAYSRLIEALHKSKAFSDANMGIDEMPQDRDRELRKQSEAAQEEISKAADIGALLLCDEAISRLKQYETESRAAGKNCDWHSYLAEDSEVTGRCIQDLIAIAKRDLRTK